MTFITKPSASDISRGVMPDFGLSQRARAAIEVLGSIQKVSAGPLRDKAAANFAAHPDGARIAAEAAPNEPTAMRARLAVVRAICEADPLFTLERFLQRYVAEEIFARGIPAVEERRAEFEAFLTPGPEKAGGTLELDPAVEAPKYYSATTWHLEPGGWDGYDLYGPMFAYVLGPMVFRYGGYAAVPLGEDITRHRVEMARRLPKERYERIYEPGCGGIAVSTALHTVFPEAELVASDLSGVLLKMGHTLAERRGIKVALKQRELLANGEPDESFDAVVMFALQHELPPKVNRELFGELFRILKPGGDMIMADPPPFREVDPFHAVILDWDTEHRDEPFFTATLLSDWEAALREAGFVNVESFPLGRQSYPWATRATKPARPGEREAA